MRSPAGRLVGRVHELAEPRPSSPRFAPAPRLLPCPAGCAVRLADAQCALVVNLVQTPTTIQVNPAHPLLEKAADACDCDGVAGVPGRRRMLAPCSSTTFRPATYTVTYSINGTAPESLGTTYTQGTAQDPLPSIDLAAALAEQPPVRARGGAPAGGAKGTEDTKRACQGSCNSSGRAQGQCSSGCVRQQARGLGECSGSPAC